MKRLLFFLLFSLILIPGCDTRRPEAGDGEVQVREAQKSDSPNFLLITVDTWRGDYLSAVGSVRVRTPNFDALVEEGILLTNVRAAAPVTLSSHATLFTGLYPPSHGARDNGIYRLSEKIETLAERLSGAGYNCEAVTGAFVLHSRYGLDHGFSFYDDVDPYASLSDFKNREFKGSAIAQRRAETVTEHALRRMEGWDTNTPQFLWVHYFDPHGDYNPPEPWKSIYKKDLYAGEVAYVDSRAGRLLETLKEKGIWDKTLVTVISDHGESLGEHGEPSHGYTLYEAAVKVAAIIKLPAKAAKEGAGEGMRSDEAVAAVDFFPTWLDALGIGVINEMPGRNLRPLWEGGELPAGPAYCETLTPFTDYGWSPLRSVVLDSWKYIQAPRPELYDLKNDPQETKNLFEKEPGRALAMQASFNALVGAMPPAPEPETLSPSDEEKAALASLGYLSGAPLAQEANPSGAWDALPDPKDRMDFLTESFDDYFEAMELHARGKSDGALARLEALLEREPGARFIREKAAQIHLSIGNWTQGLGHLEKLAKDRPADGLRRDYFTALYYLKQGQKTEALELLEKSVGACHENPESPVDVCARALVELAQLSFEAKGAEAAKALLLKYPLVYEENAGLSLKLQLVEAWALAGEKEEANRRLEDLKKKYPGNEKVEEVMGRAGK